VGDVWIVSSLTNGFAEYIGQLEGEVAAKANEANDLRIQNRALMEENARLTDLTRVLLSSSHFASFLNDASSNPQVLASQSQPQTQATVTQPPVQPNTHKDANPNRLNQDIQMQQNPQVGMAMVPEQGFDFAQLDMNNGGWNSGIDINFTNTPVFAVLDVPQGPTIDSAILSGKSSNSVGPLLSDTTKEQLPCLERLPTIAEESTSTGLADPNIEIDESDPAFALFIDQPSTKKPSAEPFESMFGGIEPEKAFARIDLVIEDESNEVSAASMDHFEHLCSSMEAAFQRVSSVTSHLS
jgi:ribonuclease Z